MDIFGFSRQHTYLLTLALFWELLSSTPFSLAQILSNTFTAPKGGDEVVMGETFTIRWTSRTGLRIDLYLCEYTLSLGTTGCELIIDEYSENTGTYAWDVPEDLLNVDDANYYIRLFYGTGDLYGGIRESDLFYIRRPAIQTSTSSKSTSSTRSSAVRTFTNTSPTLSLISSAPTSNPSTFSTTTANPTTRSESLLPTLSPTDKSSTSTAASTTSNPSAGTIAGFVVGGVALLAIGVAIGLWYTRRRRRRLEGKATGTATQSPASISGSRSKAPVTVSWAARGNSVTTGGERLVETGDVSEDTEWVPRHAG
ncbi:hypothetical protein ABW19_dt0202785 [Dactylella cylindrospora]|nr:hypothetical protein ABW19_dt0202785 [Dactylella cylindrospora]